MVDLYKIIQHFKHTIMKTIKYIAPVLGLAVISLFAFKNVQGGSIIGHITPPEGATMIWAVSISDTIKSEISPKGIFQINSLKPNTYKLMIEAKAPYKNTSKENVVVTDVTTDVGEIVLEK